MPPPVESKSKWVGRVRPPRVQITYDVNVGDAQIKKELPFVLGVLADLSGHSAEPLPTLKDRKFVEVNRDNFNRVLNAMKPRLAMRVDNQLQKDGSKLGVELKFKDMDDFEPENVVRQVEPLKKLLEARQQLADLKTKLVSNDRVNNLLSDIIQNTDKLQQLGRETGHTAPAGAPAQAEAPTSQEG